MLDLVVEKFCAGTNVTPEQLKALYDPAHPMTRIQQLVRMESSWEVLYHQAIRVRQQVTQQYRNFCVGCALLACRPDLSISDGRYKVFWGLNLKVAPDSRPCCAEPVALQSALTAGYSEVLSMVIVGEPQQDSFSGLQPPTLHPCHECRLVMATHPCMRPHTRIVTALEPTSNERCGGYQIHTLRQMLSLHDERLRPPALI